MFQLSKRWEFATMLLSGILIVYTLRVNMSIAVNDMKKDLNWTDEQKGYILSSFYWGYTIGQIPSNLLTQRYGGKWLFGLSVLIPSILTLFVPLACKFSFSLSLLIRVLIGFFESATFPSVYYFLPIWIPNTEKTLLIPFIFSGMYLGEILGFSLSGIMASCDIIINDVNYGGWPSIFYVFGSMGILWFPIWAILAYDTPLLHPTITKDEIILISQGKNISLLLQESQLSTDKIVRSIDSIEPLLAHRLLSSSSSSSSIHSSSYLMALSYNNNINNVNVSDDDHLFKNNNNNHNNNDLSVKNVVYDQNDEMTNRYFHAISSRNNSDSYSNKFQINNYRNSKGNDDDDEQQVTQLSPILQSHSNDSFMTTNTNANSTTNIMLYNNNNYNDNNYQANNNNNNNNYQANNNNNNNDIYQKEELIQRTPWKQFFIHPIALSIYLSSFGFGWIGFTLLSEMPSYLTDVLGFDLQSAGILCIFPYIALFISTLFYGHLFNYLQVEYLWTSNTVRIIAMLLTYVGSSIVLVICAFQDNKYAAYTCMIISQLFFGASQCCYGCIWTDIAPIYSSSMNSIGNTVGATAGILGPIIVASLTTNIGDDSENPWGWRIAFLLTLLISIIVSTVWYIMIKAEIVNELNTPSPLVVKNK